MDASDAQYGDDVWGAQGLPAAQAVASSALAPTPDGAMADPSDGIGLSDGAAWPAGVAPPAPAAPPQLKANEGLGFLQGLDQPFRNATIMLHNGIQMMPGGAGVNSALSMANDALGLRSDQQFLDAPAQQDAAAAARGEKPGDIGHVIGNILGTAPIAFATKNPFIGGAAQGVLTTPDPNSPQTTLLSGVGGGVLGTLGSAAAKTIGGVLSPVLAPAVQRLKDFGVDQMTSGQLTQGPLKFLEDTATSIPLVRDLVQGAQGNSLTSFNRAAVGKTLEPIGEMLPAGVEAGHDAINYAADKLGNVFNSAIAGIGHAAVDSPLVQSFQDADTLLKNATPAIQDQFRAITKNNFWDHFGQNASMPADAMQHATTQLGALSRQFSRTQDPNQQMLGHALDAAVDGIHDWIGRANPAAAQSLSAARTGWANLVRIEGAAGRGSPTGLFTPANLMAAVKSADSSPLIAGSRQAIARGTGLLQGIARDAQQVLPSKVNESGTTPRAIMAATVLGVPAAIAAHAAGGPAAWGGLLAGGLLGGAYTRPAQAMLRGVLSAERPAALQAAGNVARAAAPAAAAVGGVLGPSQAQAHGLFGVLGQSAQPQN